METKSDFPLFWKEGASVFLSFGLDRCVQINESFGEELRRVQKARRRSSGSQCRHSATQKGVGKVA